MATETGPAPRTFTYDSLGRRSITYVGTTSATITSYEHHNLPRRIVATGGVETTFLYDAAGVRALKTTLSNGTQTGATYYLDDLFESRVNESGRVHIAKIKAHGRTVAIVSDTFAGTPSPTRKVSYPHYDVQGTVMAVNGDDSTQRFNFDVFGQRVAADGRTPVAEPDSFVHEGFTGHEHENISGSLINMKGRMYDPVLRRFLTPDPIVSNLASAERWNPYAYALNNPTRYTDPTGFDPPRVNGDTWKDENGQDMYKGPPWQ